MDWAHAITGSFHPSFTMFQAGDLTVDDYSRSGEVGTAKLATTDSPYFKTMKAEDQ